jgi:hypothetical protein
MKDLRAFLSCLTDAELTKIARQFGCQGNLRPLLITFLIDQAKSYGLNGADFRSRYPEYNR